MNGPLATHTRCVILTILSKFKNVHPSFIPNYIYGCGISMSKCRPGKCYPKKYLDLLRHQAQVSLVYGELGKIIPFFSLVTLKDYRASLVGWPVLSLSIIRVGRGVLTKLMPGTVVETKAFFLGLPTERGSFRSCQCGALFISIRNQIPLPVILPTLLRLVWTSGFAWRNPRSCSTFHTFPRLCGCSYLSSQPRMWFCLCVRYDNTEITE